MAADDTLFFMHKKNEAEGCSCRQGFSLSILLALLTNPT
jgi:hypothetical protein